MPESKWIVIPIEVQRRELDAKLLCSALAIQRGYRVLVGHDQMVRRMAPYLPKGILFDKSIGADGDRKVSRYHRSGYAITAMDEEQTGFLSAPENFLETRLGDQTLAVTERWFCMSDAIRDHCIRRFPQHASRFVTTGIGRTDIWRKELSGLFGKEAEAIRTENGPFILFNSNFSVVNHARGEAFVRRQFSRFQKQYENAETEQERLFRQNAENLHEYVKIITEILEWFPEHKLVIRPHPSEDLGFWASRFSDHPRVVFSRSGVVTPWILASDCVLHHGCTTGIEAELMEQPQINYAPKPDHHHDSETAKAFSHFVHTPSELKEVMEAMVNGSREYLKPRKGLETYFASLEGKLVAEHVLDEFDKFSFTSADIAAWLPLVRFFPRNLIARYKDLSKRAKTYSSQKYEGTTVEELTGKLEFFQRALKLGKTPVVREVFDRIYLIEAATARKADG